MEGMLTVNDVTSKYSIPRGTLYRYMDRGLPYTQVGYFRLFNEAELKSWLKLNTKRVFNEEE